MTQERKRLVLFARIILIVFILIAARFFYLQIIRSSYFQEKVVEQRVKTIVQTPERGNIFDRNQNILAMSLLAQDIAVYPNLLTDPKQQERVAKLISESIGISYDEVMKKIQAKDKKGNPAPWSSIAHRVDPDKAYKIKEQNIGGIEISQSPKRYYPNNDLASSLIGFVNNDNIPGSGIEVSMNSYLSGIPGYTIAETDNLGKAIPIGFENNTSPVNGQNVQLTIDNYIQSVVENRLKQTVEELHPKHAYVIVMNPNDGQILAMASYPSFDPNNYQKSDSSTWTNSAATFVYEPGSTFKPVYMANALESGAITTSSTWEDNAGSINVHGSNIRNWDGKALGKMSLEDIITNSSNVGMIHISQSMTNDQIINGLKKAGYGQKTGIELPGEEYGLFPTAKSFEQDPVRRATVSFGQGISVTPLQLVSAFSELINGGLNINPQIIMDVKDKTGNLLYKPTEVEHTRLYKESTVTAMKGYLKANMEKGSGKTSQIEGYESGGKTGSAWVVENGVYKSGAIIGSFMGFAPYDKPQIATLVVVDQPVGAEFGSTSAGPTYHDIMTEVMRYKAIPKTNEKDSVEFNIPDVKWLFLDDAKALLSKTQGLIIDVEGEGSIVKEQEYHYINKEMHVTLHTTTLYDKIEKNYTVPNIIGKTKEDLIQLFQNANLAITYHGTVGTAEEQSVKPGTYRKVPAFDIWLNKQ